MKIDVRKNSPHTTFLCEGTIIRGHRVFPGDLAFLYRRDLGDFQFGNIEGITDSGFILSFEKSTWERRDEPVDVLFDDALIVQEFNARSPEANYIFRANEIILKTTGPDSADALAVLASQEDPMHPILVAKVVSHPGQGWVLSGEPFVVQQNEIYHPQFFSALQRYRFCSPVHPLFDILRQQVGEKMDFRQPGFLKIRTVDVPVDVHLKIEGHVTDIKLKVNYLISNLLGGVKGEYLVDERLIPKEHANPQWSAFVAVSGMSSSTSEENGFSGSVSVIPRSVKIMHFDGEAFATSETYVGAPMSAWSHLIFYRERPVNRMLLRLKQMPPNAVSFDCFGKNAIMYKPHKHDGVTHDYLSVLRLGEALQEDEHAVLSTFIGYITGGRARNVLTEKFLLNHKLETVIHDRGEATSRKQQPMPTENAWHYAKFVTRDFSKMLNEFKRWRDVDERSFDTVFHHYAEGVDSSYPVTRVLRLAIAFESFVNLVTQDKAVDEKILSKDAYESLRDSIETTIISYAGDHRDEVLAKQKRLLDKLKGFNAGSNTRRIKRFWELVPIALDDEDGKLLRRLRNDSVHKGFLGEGSQEQDVLGDARDASRLCDILNRAILYYANYEGPIVSAENGRWMNAKTGGTYRVPPIQHGGTIEMQHTVSLPPLTDEENIAIEALRGMQRDSKPFEQFMVDDKLQFPED